MRLFAIILITLGCLTLNAQTTNEVVFTDSTIMIVSTTIDQTTVTSATLDEAIKRIEADQAKLEEQIKQSTEAKITLAVQLSELKRLRYIVAKKEEELTKE